MQGQNFNRVAIQKTSTGTFEVRTLKRDYRRDGCAGVLITDTWYVPTYARLQFTGAKDQCIEFAVERGAMPVLQ